MMNRIAQLSALGQAIWLDYISRDLLAGQLETLVEEGVAGVTSNPTIFQKAVAAGGDYAAQIGKLAAAGRTPHAIYEAIVLQDIAAAADQLRPVYNETHGRDGFVSLEVRPTLADDTEGTIDEARRLFHTLQRPNVMIKVPATEAGLPAIAALIGEGINVNVTLIFSVAMYERVINAYMEGLRRFGETGRPLASVSSVASFFVSRVDSLVDGLLEEQIARGGDHLEDLLGKAAVANSKIAYQKFKEVFGGARFLDLRSEGARVQRPLWASTSTKNPTYPDTKYVDPLIGVNTVNTVPPVTLDAIRDHGIVAQTIEADVGQSLAVMNRLREFGGVDMQAVTDRLLREGVKLFADSFEQLMAEITRTAAAKTATRAG